MPGIRYKTDKSGKKTRKKAAVKKKAATKKKSAPKKKVADAKKKKAISKVEKEKS